MKSAAVLTLQQLAAETGLPIKSLYALCAPHGDLPCVRRAITSTAKRRTHGRIWVRREEWEAWLERHRCAPAAAERRTAAPLSNLPGADRYAS